MRCPSCGAVTEASDCCTESELMLARGQDCSEDQSGSPRIEMDMTTKSDDASSENLQRPRKSSTLIEFPGVARSSLPEWRKELSERVREVQERRARDAAYEAAEAERRRLEADTSPPQLELLPQATMPAINPLVAAALRRIERAHQGTTLADNRGHRASTAAAVAYSPVLEESEPYETKEVSSPATLEFDSGLEATSSEPAQPKTEKSHNLVMVAVSQSLPTQRAEKMPPPTRLIRDDPNDPALNYLDSISREIRVEEVSHKRASMPRRLFCAVLDLIISAFLCSPIIVAMKMTNNDFHDVRIVAFSAVVLIVMTFIYLTLSVALTGRTWGMRSLSLRVIDSRTGLIPTGSQSAGRAFVYLISLCTVGLGILYALLSREGYTVHDRLTRTEVIGL
ncbi:MAG: hypothetical protein QOH96_4096 [Blastocatellia bacterium]|nr:hypothetical protein [Blastocatellia bacterium]